MHLRRWALAGGLTAAAVAGAVALAALGGGSAAAAGGTDVLLLVDASGVTTPVDDLTSFTFGVATASTAGGANSSGTTFKTLTVQRPLDGASLAVFKELVQGARYSAASLVVPGGRGGEMTYQFRDLSAQRITWSGGGSGHQVETVDFTYGALELTYTGAGAASPASFAWNALTDRPGL